MEKVLELQWLRNLAVARSRRRYGTCQEPIVLGRGFRAPAFSMLSDGSLQGVSISACQHASARSVVAAYTNNLRTTLPAWALAALASGPGRPGWGYAEFRRITTASFV
jgi:hypothetical protein